jgi:HSP20 family protein
MDGNFGNFFEIARIQSEVNKLFDVLLQHRTGDGEGAQPWLPNVDVCETEDTVVVRCELPGVPRSDLRLTAQGTTLILSGEKEFDKPGSQAKFHCMERAVGSFQRVVHLPPMVNTRGATAKLDNGVLTVLLPKVSNRRGEEFAIPVEEE